MISRIKPRLSYNGLTIVMSNPSRFDERNHTLLSATAESLVNYCLKPDYNVYQCDIRLKEDTTTLLPGTKCVLLLGQSAATSWLNNTTNTLNEIRGSVYIHQDIPHVASYFPQDCKDIKDYEHEYRSANHPQEQQPTDIEDDDEEDSAGEKRRHGRTKRKNFGFWLLKDIQKCKKIMQYGFKPEPECEYVVWPGSSLVIDELTKHKNEHLYFDMETDTSLNMLCFSFSFSSSSIVFCVPILDHLYQPAYSNLALIIKALSISIRDNILVAHNGSGFDFVVLGFKYHIPIYRVYDTMLAQHRCFPETEKSLGHCTSLWTNQPFHKDEGSAGWFTASSVMKTLAYCGKDVFTMKLIHAAISEYAKTIPGLRTSIEQVMASIKPYLIITLTGIRYRQQMLKDIMSYNDRLMIQYMRCIRILIGEKSSNVLSKRFKSALPASNPQCVEYFHNMLGYPFMGKGKLTKTGARNPSLAKKNMFKLRLKFNNPVIDFCIAFRELAKESGSLKFTPWKE